MAMFDLKDCDDAKLERCKTSSETLVKAENSQGLHALDCEAATPNVATPKPHWSKRALSWCLNNMTQIIVGLIIAAVGSYLGFS